MFHQRILPLSSGTKSAEREIGCHTCTCGMMTSVLLFHSDVVLLLLSTDPPSPKSLNCSCFSRVSMTTNFLLASLYLLCFNYQCTALSCLSQSPCMRALSRPWIGAKRTSHVELTSVCPSVSAPMSASTSEQIVCEFSAAGFHTKFAMPIQDRAWSA
jgi:hypothetical protein